MSRILLIDSNPENRKSLEGLLRYRTHHDFAVVESHTEGARKAVSLAPDLIMMNVLLFMGNNYAFPRVLQQHDKTKDISFLVQVNGHLDEVTERQIQASGMADIVYLPVSAEELESAISEALSHSSTQDVQAVAPVVWPQAGQAQQEPRPTSADQSGGTHKTATVKPVQWPTVEKNTQQPKSKLPPKQVTDSKRTNKARRPQEKHQETGFRVANFDQVADQTQTKRPSEFKTPKWQTVDPKDLKKRK
ncbi:MAG: response regulator [Candidatus Latescibacteria bacterium]|jgi:CheY-like chemotaxis protein|nr:response regulator [Candidatus Latescibacterota bacterium]MBT4140443.1 response regulator [Candidatus Latescibacterota bacterium]MBT5829100.1 response regulator [Candidatus Latescibacterota bacterium]